MSTYAPEGAVPRKPRPFDPNGAMTNTSQMGGGNVDPFAAPPGGIRPPSPGATTGGNMTPGVGQTGGIRPATPGGISGGNVDPNAGGTGGIRPSPLPPATTSPVAPPVAPTAPTPAPHKNFSWGVHGKGVEGVDYGNTATWDEGKWQQYYKDHGITPPAAPAAPPTAPPAAPTTPDGMAGGNPVPTAPVAPTAPAGPPQTIADSFKSALMQRLSPQAASADSAQIKPAIQANKLAEQRGAERQREMLAAQAARDGTSGSGGMDAAMLGIQQDRAAREGQFAGGQVASLAKQQAQELTSALALGGQYLSDQDRMALQERLATLQATIQREGHAHAKSLAEMDADLRRKALDQSGSLGGRELDIRDRLGEAGINANLLGMLLQNQQFGQGLNQNAAQFGQQLDTNTLLQLLGGF